MSTEITLYSRLLNWVSSEQELEQNNPVPKLGEDVLLINPVRKKIGDGITVYNSLPFDTNHYQIPIAEASVITLYNLITQTSFFYKRVTEGTNDITIRLDSFKDSNRGFSQCDGRMHKILVQNTLSSTMDIELTLSTEETTDNSIIHDIGSVTISGNSIVVIEFSWFKNNTDNKICFCRILSDSSGGGDITFSVPPRIENTSGNETLYNPTQRTFYLLDINNASTAYVVTISRKAASGGTAAFTNVEHYVLIRNTAAAAKTLAVQLETTGDKMDSEGLSAVSIPASGIYEVGYIWVARGNDNLCIITKSTLLSEITK